MRFVHNIDDLERDLKGIAVRAPKDLNGIVRDGVRAGNELAKRNAERTAGAHGVHYPKAFTSEMRPTFYSSRG